MPFSMFEDLRFFVWYMLLAWQRLHHIAHYLCNFEKILLNNEYEYDIHRSVCECFSRVLLPTPPILRLYLADIALYMFCPQVCLSLRAISFAVLCLKLFLLDYHHVTNTPTRNVQSGKFAVCSCVLYIF